MLIALISECKNNLVLRGLYINGKSTCVVLDVLLALTWRTAWRQSGQCFIVYSSYDALGVS